MYVLSNLASAAKSSCDKPLVPLNDRSRWPKTLKPKDGLALLPILYYTKQSFTESTDYGSHSWTNINTEISILRLMHKQPWSECRISLLIETSYTKWFRKDTTYLLLFARGSS